VQLPSRLASAAPERRLATSAVLLAALIAAGVAGFMIIEGWSFLDALYMTVTTITTVGFREVNPLSTGGRIFTIILIILGVGVLFYTLTSLVRFFVEGELIDILGVRRMKGRIENLRDHYILCGFGRVGEEIARDFVDRGMPFVIVETNPEAIARAQRRGYLLLEGDATQDAVLREAGVLHARCLLAASDSDAGNTFIVLTAKALNPNLFLVARAGHPESEPRMLRAGAERVFSPYIIAGRRMALSALQPLVVDFIETLATARQGEQILAEIEISSESGLAGQSIHDVLHACQSVVVLGLQNPTGEIQVGPRNTLQLEEGDRLIVLGDEAELESIRPAAGQPKREAVS
jgi:voltage-gated potassium channel